MLKHIDEMTQNIISFILDKKIEISIKKDQESEEIYFDLNTQAKSWLHLYPNNDNSFTVRGRYGYETTISYNNSEEDDFNRVFKELCYEIKHCLHGRDFMNTDWIETLVEQNVLTRTIQVTEKIILS